MRQKEEKRVSNGFMDFTGLDSAVLEVATVAIAESLKVQPGERVLIITNPVRDVATLAYGIHDAVQNVGGVPLLLVQPVKSQLEFCEEEVIAAIATEPPVVVSLSAEKLGKDRRAIKEPYRVGEKTYDSTLHYLLHGVKRVRSFWSPGITVDSFLRTIPVDYRKMKEDCTALKNILDRAVSLEVENPGGTKVRLRIEGRKAFTDDGDFSKPGTGGNLPAGEAFLSPMVGSAEGTIVFDGTIATPGGVLRIQTPIRAQVEKGFVISLSGGEEARILQKALEEASARALEFEAAGKIRSGEGNRYAQNARHIGELGIGVNRKAILTGNMLEDEKVYGTCHFALGSNYDEDAPSLIHLDGLVSKPTIQAQMPDGSWESVMKEGAFPWE